MEKIKLLFLLVSVAFLNQLYSMSEGLVLEMVSEPISVTSIDSDDSDDEFFEAKEYFSEEDGDSEEEKEFISGWSDKEEHDASGEDDSDDVFDDIRNAMTKYQSLVRETISLFEDCRRCDAEKFKSNLKDSEMMVGEYAKVISNFTQEEQRKELVSILRELGNLVQDLKSRVEGFVGSRTDSLMNLNFELSNLSMIVG